MFCGFWHASRLDRNMDTIFIPKKFEIQFKRTSEDQYTGALIIDGMEMGVGTPKTLEEITAFLMTQPSAIPARALCSAGLAREAA
jgi:hypothetical protein